MARERQNFKAREGAVFSTSSVFDCCPVFLPGSFVSDVVHIYYTSDEAVQADEEIQAFIKDVCSFGMQDFDHCGGCTWKTSRWCHFSSSATAATNKVSHSRLIIYDSRTFCRGQVRQGTDSTINSNVSLQFTYGLRGRTGSHRSPMVSLAERRCRKALPEFLCFLLVSTVHGCFTKQPLRKRKEAEFLWRSKLTLNFPMVCHLCTEFPKSLKSREELTEYLTVIVFTASAQHAAVNFGQVSDRSSISHSISLYYIQNKRKILRYHFLY